MNAEKPMGILQRSAGLVELLAEEGTLSPAEIAERIDTPRPTVYRLAEALEQAGLTEMLPNSRIALNLRWLRLGDAARAVMSEWRSARPILDELADATHQIVFLSVLRGEESVCIDWAQDQANNVLLLKPGRGMPLYCGAEGRCALAFGIEDVESYLAKAPFPAYNSRTLTTAAVLRGDVALSRDQGFTISDQDVTEGVSALGAPLHSRRTGNYAGTLSVAGLAENMAAPREDLSKVLLRAAEALSATLP